MQVASALEGLKVTILFPIHYQYLGTYPDRSIPILARPRGTNLFKDSLLNRAFNILPKMNKIYFFYLFNFIFSEGEEFDDGQFY